MSSTILDGSAGQLGLAIALTIAVWPMAWRYAKFWLVRGDELQDDVIDQLRTRIEELETERDFWRQAAMRKHFGGKTDDSV